MTPSPLGSTPSSGSSGATSPGGGTVALVQNGFATPASPVSGVNLAFESPEGSGNSNILAIGWNDTTASILAVSDSAGNAYRVALPTDQGSGLSQAIYYATSIAGGANTVSVTFSQPANYVDLRIAEYSGITGFDVGTSNSGSGIYATSGTVSTSDPDELIFGAAMTTDGFISPGNGFTGQTITSPDGDIAEYEWVRSAGQYSATAPLSDGGWLMQVAAFKTGSNPGSGPAPGPTVTPSSLPVSSPTPTPMPPSKPTPTPTPTPTPSPTAQPSSTSTPGGGLPPAPQPQPQPQPQPSQTGSGSVPALVQGESSSSTRDASMGSPYCYYYQLANGTLSGNAVVAGFVFSNGVTPSVTDDKGDSYSILENDHDGADGASIGIAAAFHVSAGARTISLCFSGDPGQYVQPMAAEFANVVDVDGNATANRGSGTVAAAGSLAPTQGGDLVFQISASLTQLSNLSRGQAAFGPGAGGGGVSWNLLSADLMDGLATQYGVSDSASPVTPSMTLGTSANWLTAAVLLKAGASGSVPSGLRIVHLAHENVPHTWGGGSNGTNFANPLPLQFPSSGNLLVAMIGGGNLAVTVNQVTDSGGDSWSQAGSTYVQAGNDEVQAFYAPNALTSSDLDLSMVWSGSDGDYNVFLYDVAGASSSPLDQANGSTGYQSTAGPLTMSYAMNPAAPGEIILSEAVWDANTGSGLEGQLFDTNTFSGESQSGPEPVDQNNGWGHVITNSTAPVGVTWDLMFGGLPVYNYAGMSISFKGN